MSALDILILAQRFYLFDWLAVLVLTVIRLLLRNVLQPHYRMFRLDDPRIQFPMADPETVGGLALVVSFLFAPLGIIVVWAVVFRPRPSKVHLVILGLFCSTATASFLVAITKNAVGRPRPDLLARCIPKADTDSQALVSVQVCTQTSSEILQEGFRSFPSGHSGSAFSGLAYLSLFLASQFELFRNPHSGGRGSQIPVGTTWFPPSLVLILVALVPSLGAAMIAISRLQDYRHDFADVIVGSAIGLGVAYASWRRFFPSLAGAHGADPYVDGTGHVPSPSPSASGPVYVSLGDASAVTGAGHGHGHGHGHDMEMGTHTASSSPTSGRRRPSLGRPG